MSINHPQHPVTISLQLSAEAFERLSYTRIGWAGFADQAADDRFEFDASIDPWDDRWEGAEICFHGENNYAEALIARSYLTAIGAEWIALWDMAESRPGELFGHVTVFLAPTGY